MSPEVLVRARPPKLMSSAVEAPVPMFMVSAPVPVPKFRVRVKDPPAPRLNVVAAVVSKESVWGAGSQSLSSPAARTSNPWPAITWTRPALVKTRRVAPDAEAVKISWDSVWFIMAADNPRVKLPARDILAELVAVEPKLTSVVSEKGERTPEFNCHLLPPEPPEQLPVVKQTVPVSSGKVNVRSAVKSAVGIVPVKKDAPELLGERLKESALATLESKVNRESVSTLKRKSPAPPTV